MKTLKNTFGILATLMLLSTLNINAQPKAQLLTKSDKSVVVRGEGDKQLDKPERVNLVYDSGLITLETTSTVVEAYKSRSCSAGEGYKALSSLESALSVETEEDIELEDWMLSPFESSNQVNIKEDIEEEMPIEAWMSDFSSWPQ